MENGTGILDAKTITEVTQSKPREKRGDPIGEPGAEAEPGNDIGSRDRDDMVDPDAGSNNKPQREKRGDW